MRAFVRPEALAARQWRPAWTAVVLGVLLSGNAVAADGLRVVAVQPRLANGLLLSGNLDLSLPPKVEEALNNGIPLEFTVDVRLYRRRPLLWDPKAGAWTLRRELRFHALSGQYLVTGHPALPQSRESFNTLPEALVQAGALDEILSVAEPIVPGAEYRVAVRARLDIEALPHLLRPRAYTSRAWDLDSGWTTWQVQR